MLSLYDKIFREPLKKFLILSSIAGTNFNGDGIMDIALYQKKILEVFLRKATAPSL
jgi:hypothetical protein